MLENFWEFDNKLVKSASQECGFGNPFDATKIDHSHVLPEIYREKDKCLIHLGRGRHAIVDGIGKFFHCLEPIDSDEEVKRPYKKSILNEADTSESNILSVIFNQGIIGEFLYEGAENLQEQKTNIYIARRAKFSGNYIAGNKDIKVESVQIEIDMVLECEGCITIFEAKNNPRNIIKDFSIYQIFLPYLYYCRLEQEGTIENVESIDCCYVLRARDKLSLYLYEFSSQQN